jgi:two-component system chemotaxis response regulator CheV
MQDKHGILLESGTNEFEIIEFTVDNTNYGINVAKVREIVDDMPVTRLAKAHPYVDGVFSLRDKVIPLVNLRRCLASNNEEAKNHKIIVCEINNIFIGFKVDEVSRIYRIFWTQMEPVPEIAGSDLVVGIVKMDERLIILLDFEKIISDISPEMNEKLMAVPASTSELVKIRNTKTILIAEDSRLLREMMLNTLHTAGYNTIVTENGQEAWDKLLSLITSESPVEDYVQLVITDIEMPKMDGHHLTKKIKEHVQLKELPVVIFSSLINVNMKRKGEALGAYAQITKPEIEQLIGIIDKKIAL